MLALLSLAIAASPLECHVDLNRVMALPVFEFDQDSTAGWRSLETKQHCHRVIADLIASYRKIHGDRLGILYWHEGQIRAGLGETGRAISLMNRSRQKDNRNAWNQYVDATVAFLEGRKDLLLEAKKSLESAPKPSDWNDNDGTNPWPPNSKPVQMLIACFGVPYADIAINSCSQMYR